MKNSIIYYYNIVPENLMEVNSSYSFYINYDKYYLLRIKRPKEDIDEIISIVAMSPRFFHIPIPNISGSYLTKINDDVYILIKVNGPENSEIDMRDILSSTIPYDVKKPILVRTNWGVLWSEKVDYLEYQISELAVEKNIIKRSFSYYVGLAENAIEYFNLLNPSNAKTYVAHRRIKYPTISLNFYDPLNIVIDYRVRDIASYLKMKFFNVSYEEIMEEVDLVIEKGMLTSLEYNLLFARLLYPSYYFDDLYRVLELGYDEESLLVYIEKVHDYEKFLNDVFIKFSSQTSMIVIDWLIKKS